MTAVITGLGVTAPTGIGVAEHWDACLSGRSGLGPITHFDPGPYPVKFAGQVPGFDTGTQVPNRLVPQTDRWTHLGLAAARLALEDADVDPADFGEFDMAVVTSSSSGGTEFGQKEIEKLWSRGPQWVGAYQSIAWFYAATTGQVSIRYGMRGPCGVICTEQAGGLDALAQARRMLRHGARLVVTGGTDAPMCPYGLTAQLATGRLSLRDDPDRAYLPFDVDACGYLPGEGGAILVTETAEGARARGARIYAEIAGYAATFDPRPGSTGEPNLRRAAESALADAGLTPSDVDVVFADAAGDRDRDLIEATAISALFGPHRVPVTVPKTLTGRLYAGGAALDVASAALALTHGVIPASYGITEVAPGCDLDLVLDEARPAPLRSALVLARGHGGFNAALVLTSPT
ncbi:MAG TPA: ketosynthase chain-length factor [Micromonosporaceae bacterium]